MGDSVVWPFSKKKPPPAFPQKLLFKSGSAFLEYQCEYGFTEIKVKQGIVALVLDGKNYGESEGISVGQDGRQFPMLKVASKDGGFIVPSQTPTGKGDRLKPDDVVIWVPVKHLFDDMPGSMDKRIGWAGYAVAKVAPEIDMANPNFNILSRYD